MAAKDDKEQKQKALQQRYMEMQILNEQIQQVQKTLQNVDEKLAEIEMMKESLQSMDKMKENTEMFVPMLNGIFTKVEIKDTKEVLVNVGANIVVSKKVPDAMALIDRQNSEMGAYRTQVADAYTNLVQQAKLIERELTLLAQG